MAAARRAGSDEAAKANHQDGSDRMRPSATILSEFSESYTLYYTLKYL
jgi:hypothetical protein